MEKIKFQKIILRKCRDEDYQFVYDLSKQNMEYYVNKYWGGWNPNKFKANFNKKNIVIISYQNKKIGFYDMDRKKNSSYLHNMQLIKTFQKRGIGTYLMSLIEKQLHNNKISSISLEVFKENPAKSFYLNLRFKINKDNGNSLSLEKTID